MLQFKIGNSVLNIMHFWNLYLWHDEATLNMHTHLTIDTTNEVHGRITIGFFSGNMLQSKFAYASIICVIPCLC